MNLSARIRVLADLVSALERDGTVPAGDVAAACSEADALAVLVALGLVAAPGTPPRPQAPRQGPSRAATSTDPTPAVAGPSSAVQRRLRYRFVHRLGRFACIPADVTWEAATAPGSPWRGTVEGDGRRPGTRPETVPVPQTGTQGDATGTLPGRTGTHRDAPTDRDAGGRYRDACGTPPSPVFPGLCDEAGRSGTRPGPSPSSPLTLPSSSSESPEKEEEARGTGTTGTQTGTHRDAQDRDASGRTGTPPSPTVPTATRENPLEVLARASRGRVSTLASTHDQMALALQLTAVGLAGAELEAFGAALAGDGLKALWPKSEAVARLRPHQAVNAGFFLGRTGEARMLVDGVQRWREAQAEAAARKAAPPRPAAAPARLPALPLDPAAAGARARALLGRPAPAPVPSQVSP